jgi:hypothetical protein
VRLHGVVARAALIAALALVLVPGSAGSRNPSVPGAIDPSAFGLVALDQPLTTTTTLAPNPAILSDGRLDAETVLREPQPDRVGLGAPRPAVLLPAARPLIRDIWKYDPEISWYGPGFNGNGGACGMFGANGLGPEDVGVAHRTLPCGTWVTFRYNGRTVVTQVKDRGPYVPGRIWDMTRGLCEALGHCFTGGGVYYKIG